MKRFLTSALILALSIGAANAQKSDTARHKGGKHDGKGRHEMGYKGLDLTADQQAKIKAINESYRDKMKALKDGASTSDADKKAQREALHQQHKAEISAVLTAEQRAKAEATKKDYKAKGGDFKKGGAKDGKEGKSLRKEGADRKDGRGAKEGRGRGGDMAKELNLTTEQQAKLEAIRKENRTKLEALRNDAALTQEQKRTKMGEIMKAQQAQLQSILTKEQQEKMKSGRKTRPATTK